MKIKKKGPVPRPILEGHQILQGLDLRLVHLTPLFESAQRAMEHSICELILLSRSSAFVVDTSVVVLFVLCLGV